MSESRSPLSVLWVVALLPLGLGVGWLVGQAPGRPSQDAGAPATAAAPAPEPSAAMGTAPRPASTAKAVPKEPPAEVSAWTTLPGALAESRRNGKPVLLDFNADWCPPCQRMKRELFEDRGLGAAVQTAVIPVSIVDRRRENGSNPAEIEELQRRYQIEAFPTLVVFSPATGRTVKTEGFGGAAWTMDWITEAARSVR